VNLAGIGGIMNVPVRGQADLTANGSSLWKIWGGGPLVGTPSCVSHGRRMSMLTSPIRKVD
jgi:hypothetical protein